MQVGNTMEALTKWDNWLALVMAITLGYASNCLISKLIALRPGRPRFVYASMQGKHIVITGGSTGIGYSLAAQALQEGASVTLVAHNLESLQQATASLVHDLLCSPSAVHVLRSIDATDVADVVTSWPLEEADVSDAAAVAAAICDAQARVPIDVLVCNADVMVPGELDGLSVAQVDDLVRVNILGCIYPIRAVIPLMKSRSSRTSPQSIVLVSSLASLYQCDGASVYASTQYAQRGLAATLKYELLPYNIHVHVVCPMFAGTQGSPETNFQNLRNAREVAKAAWDGVKRGRFLITTDSVGQALELLLLVPLRVFSFVLKWSLTRKMRRFVNVAAQA